ncbi:grasp-with-spasm system ATP-grasp peptide maturase [Chryseobacterium sp.]|uniref:grasp-with-spasm system ATP-grasp peptide maturase n=1 Tax=Chryseobacterium sp. TaxID=1871047 RepID=UPI000EB90156|nr:grasp-with-spasm system ATP-grasp peptide maturase [Chryseobacterium sp.]HCA09958.1 grasp-with-spasm system ATP-grasp peptide maturase [Chryseobacterium sp.]
MRYILMVAGISPHNKKFSFVAGNFIPAIFLLSPYSNIMYLIQSSKEDKSTNDVLDWIFFLKNNQEIRRFNDSVPIEHFTFRLSDNDEKININRNNVKSQDVSSFWYRRGMFSFPISLQEINNPVFKKIVLDVYDNFSREMEHISNCLYYILRKKGDINIFQENFTNKIANLSLAKEAGIHIPDVLITNDLSELLQFSADHKNLITKDIEMNMLKADYDENYRIMIGAGIQILSQEDIIIMMEKYKYPRSAEPAFYQQYIEKKYELRIFYLKGKFYTMAIFSQANEKTKIDFRNYDTERPNRCIPYKLPQEIEDKLRHFMQSIDMNCGSIDMIYTPEKEYVFLEVNPVGQFQWLSRNCNYDIEREIALELIKEKP